LPEQEHEMGRFRPILQKNTPPSPLPYLHTLSALVFVYFRYKYCICNLTAVETSIFIRIAVKLIVLNSKSARGQNTVLHGACYIFSITKSISNKL
jgi:hypothetical protein